MGSSRLPGKVLKDIAGKTMLERVVTRVRVCERVSEVVVATTVESADDAVVTECARLEAPVHRGSVLDVLDRYHGAACAHAAQAVVRVTSDCPLIDPRVVDEIIGAFVRDGSDYASNSIEHSYPRGLDAEVFTMAALERSHREARIDFERVHVTPYIYRHPEIFRLTSVRMAESHADLRWTVDTPEDLELARLLYARVGRDAFGWRDALAVVEADPTLRGVNQHIRQKALEEC